MIAFLTPRRRIAGRFPQVSNIIFQFDPSAKSGSRIQSVKVSNEPIDLKRKYVLATRDYMARGKDGYDCLLYESEGGVAEEIISEENGILISMLLRQYFLSMLALGRWRKWSQSLHEHWDSIQGELHHCHPAKECSSSSPNGNSEGHVAMDEDENESGLDDAHSTSTPAPCGNQPSERELHIMRRVFRKWWRLTGLPGHPHVGGDEEEFTVTWTKAINPKLEGRILIVGQNA